jgi:hypothetical protein
MANCFETGSYQTDHNIPDGERGQAICEDDAFRGMKIMAGTLHPHQPMRRIIGVLRNQSMD